MVPCGNAPSDLLMSSVTAPVKKGVPNTYFCIIFLLLQSVSDDLFYYYKIFSARKHVSFLRIYCTILLPKCDFDRIML